MTDNEIIKALEWLSVKKGVCSSEDDFKYGEILEKFITRQKAEIERLQTEKAKLHKLIPKMIKEAKSEAINEFAERLKEEYADFDELHEEIRHDNLIYAIDNLVKEMTEQEG